MDPKFEKDIRMNADMRRPLRRRKNMTVKAEPDTTAHLAASQKWQETCMACGQE